jgi:hypothetical protein
MRLLGQNNSGTTFYCFSPLVMIVTCVIELVLAFYVIYRYKLTVKSQLILAILFFLAIFQLCEYMISGYYGNPDIWSRIGFVAITFLPAFGLHLIDTIGKPRYFHLAIIGYALALIASLYFVLVPGSLTSVSMGNYIIFHVAESYDVLYGTYYYGVIATYLYLARHKMSKADITRSEKIGLASFSIGTLTFLIPTVIVSILNSETQAAIPSIMCGFALIFAFITAFKVAPVVAKLR